MRPFNKCKRKLEELCDLEERYYSITFSKLNIDKFEKNCTKNFLYYQEGMAKKYRREKMCRGVLQVIWLTIFFCVGVKLLEVRATLMHYSVTDNVFLFGVLVVSWLALGEILAINLMQEIFPLYTLIKRQSWFARLVRIEYYPIFEFQEKLKKIPVKCIKLKPLQAIMELEYEDEKGNLDKIQMEVPRGCTMHWIESELDFSFVDRMIMQKAEQVGVRFEEL